MQYTIRRGFTLLEVLIASVVFLIVVVASMGLLTSTDKTVGASLKITDLVLQADRLASRVREELTQATGLNVNETNTQVPEILGADNWTTVTYNKIDSKTTVINTADGLATAATLIPRELRFRWDEAPDNAAPLARGNDIDDDNDGLIDEGVVELWEGAAPALVAILARNVSSGPEKYEPGGAPWTIYPGTTPPPGFGGTRGGPFSFQFTPSANLQTGANQRGITFSFTLVGRLPVLAEKAAAGPGKFPVFHHEPRTVNIAFRSTGS